MIFQITHFLHQQA